MKFCTVINCIDGRVQLPVIEYLKKRFDVEFVYTITEPGPTLILADRKYHDIIQSIHDKLRFSISEHNSVGAAIVCHHGCIGNPAPKIEQIAHLRIAIRLLQIEHVGTEIIGLWVTDKSEVEEVT